MLGGPPMTSLAAMAGALMVRITFDNLASLLAGVVFVIVLGLVSSRLLGITVGRWRSMATALVGTLIGVAGAQAVVHGGKDGVVAWALTACSGSWPPWC